MWSNHNFQIRRRTLTEKANDKIFRKMQDVDNKEEQLVSVIDHDLRFLRNSINLYIGMRGSGKTFNVLREMIKLSDLPYCGGFNGFIYVTDKTNDDTFKEMLSLIKLKIRIISYADANKFLADFIDAKAAYQEILDKGLLEETSEECVKDLMEALDLEAWGEPTPGTVVLYDDAINIFKRAAFSKLLDLLFKNRQPRITYFLCVQAPFSIPPEIKSNADTCIVFGGFKNQQMLHTLFLQLNGSPVEISELIREYRKLGRKQGLVFETSEEGCEVSVLEA
jgi:hypothetical protein